MTFALCRLHDGAPAPAPALPASRAVERDRAAQTFVELHPGLIAHQLTRLGDRGERALHFTRARGFVFRQDRYAGQSARSEERRVGKESRSRWSPYHSKKNK